MKDHVDFLWGNNTRPITGYAGGVCPVDKAAELVLSSSECGHITKIQLSYDDEFELTAKVVGVLKENRQMDETWTEVEAWPPRRDKWADK